MRYNGDTNAEAHFTQTAGVPVHIISAHTK